MVDINKRGASRLLLVSSVGEPAGVEKEQRRSRSRSRRSWSSWRSCSGSGGLLMDVPVQTSTSAREHVPCPPMNGVVTMEMGIKDWAGFSKRQKAKLSLELQPQCQGQPRCRTNDSPLGLAPLAQLRLQTIEHAHDAGQAGSNYSHFHQLLQGNSEITKYILLHSAVVISSLLSLQRHLRPPHSSWIPPPLPQPLT